MAGMKPIKVLIAIPGIDQHEVGAIAIAHHLRDAGMEVVYAGRFQLPPAIARTAIEEDVDVVGLSCHSGEYRYILPEIVTLLEEGGRPIPIVVGGSILTSQDERELIQQGVRATFGPNSSLEEVVQAIHGIVGKR